MSVPDVESVFGRIHNDGDEDTPLCEECYYNGEYLSCSRCGRVLTDEEARYIEMSGLTVRSVTRRSRRKKSSMTIVINRNLSFMGKGSAIWE